MNIIRSEKINVFENIYDEYETLFKTDSTVTGFDTTFNEEISQKFNEDTAEFVPDIPS